MMMTTGLRKNARTLERRNSPRESSTSTVATSGTVPYVTPSLLMVISPSTSPAEMGALSGSPSRSL